MEGEKTILVVEDEAPLRNALRDDLSREGFSVLEAKDGKEGLEGALKKHPDLILLDIVMPKMDGMAMLDALRADPWGKDARVVLLTNVSDSERVSQAISGRAYQYLVKTDWRIKDVVKKVKEILEKR